MSEPDREELAAAWYRGFMAGMRGTMIDGSAELASGPAYFDALVDGRKAGPAVRWA